MALRIGPCISAFQVSLLLVCVCLFGRGPVLVMILEKVNAVADWFALIGPTDAWKAKVTHPHSIRAMCGQDLEKSYVHGSDSPLSADGEIPFLLKSFLQVLLVQSIRNSKTWTLKAELYVLYKPFYLHFLPDRNG